MITSCLSLRRSFTGIDSGCVGGRGSGCGCPPAGVCAVLLLLLLEEEGEGERRKGQWWSTHTTKQEVGGGHFKFLSATYNSLAIIIGFPVMHSLHSLYSVGLHFQDLYDKSSYGIYLSIYHFRVHLFVIPLPPSLPLCSVSSIGTAGSLGRSSVASGSTFNSKAWRGRDTKTLMVGGALSCDLSHDNVYMYISMHRTAVAFKVHTHTHTHTHTVVHHQRQCGPVL